MSFILSTIKNLAGSNPVAEETGIAKEAHEADSGGVKLPSPCGTVTKMGIPDAESDFNQWLHAMKMVARLPGGMPPDFRRKLWLALSDRYLQNKDVNWKKEEEKCFSETWGADDQELGVQIVKDLHRTGSSLCSGPAGTINQAKLKRILLGYARWNPEVGYCQGFNMLGALILQVMDKNESDAIKVMIFLIEGLIPSGYFHGALGGLQADMAVFRELLGTKLPKLARHLQKLQGPQDERALEPPLTNVFTMQWFLTLFCNCLPINCVLRVWDLILIEGSDVLLRTALAIWSLLEDKILLAKTADDFYCKMGILSGELLNGTLIDSNGLVQKIVDFGPIKDLDRMRERHRQSIPSLKQKKGLKVFYSDDDLESDEESKMAVATVWGGLRGQNRRNSQPNVRAQNNVDTKQSIALDINILKKQYNKLRERQKQAHVILSSAVARQPSSSSNNASNPPQPATTSGNQVNSLLAGKSAIISNKRRIGPPPGAVPLARNIKQSKPIKVPPKSGGANKQGSLNWKDIKQDENTTKQRDDQTSKKRHDSSSYSEDSDSSTSTSLCDDDPPGLSCSSVEGSPLKKDLFVVPVENRVENLDKRIADLTEDFEGAKERKMLEFESILESTTSTGAESGNKLSSETINNDNNDNIYKDIEYERMKDDELDVELAGSFSPLEEFSPINDAPKFLSISPISPFRTPSPILDYSSFIKSLQTNQKNTSSSSFTNPSITTTTHETSSTALAIKSNQISDGNNVESSDNQFIVTDEGVTNELFERINSADPRLKSPSTVLELPIGISSLPDASIIPACADMAAIPADRSPLINQNIFNLDDTKMDVDAVTNDPHIDSLAMNSSPSKEDPKEPVCAPRRESSDLTAFMEESSKMLSRITTRKADIESTAQPSSLNKTEMKSSMMKSDQVSSPKSSKLTKRVTFSEEDNKVELIEARTPTDDDDVHIVKLSEHKDVDDVPSSPRCDEADRGNYFMDTMDEIVQEQAQRKLKNQITEMPEGEEVDNELIHEEQIIVEKQGKYNEMSGKSVLEECDNVKIDRESPKAPNSEPKTEKNTLSSIEKETFSRKTLREESYETETEKPDVKVTSYKFDPLPDSPVSTFKKEDLKIESKKNDIMSSSTGDLPSDMSSSYTKASRKSVADYHMSSFDEMTLEIRKEMHGLKADISGSASKVGKSYSDMKYDENREFEKKYKRPESLQKADDVSLEQLSTDTLKALLNETKDELRKDFYGSQSNIAKQNSPIRDRSPVKISIAEVATRKSDDERLSPYQRSPIKTSRESSPVKELFVLKDNTELLRNSARNREFADQLNVKENKDEKTASPVKLSSSRDHSPVKERFLSKANSNFIKNATKNRQFADQLDVKDSEDDKTSSPVKLSPRAELHAILTKPSIKESMDFSYLDNIREPSLNDTRCIKLFSTNEEIKTPNLRDPTNINDKISSISKTINSINNLCRGETKYELTYRTLERYCDKKDVHSVRKEMDQNRLDKVLDDIMIKSAAPTPIVKVSDADEFQIRKEFTHSPRSASRESSPRRADDEFEARVSRQTSNLRYAATSNFDKLDRYMFKKESEFALASLPYDSKKRSFDNLYTRSTSPKTSNAYPDNLDIRHSTVTSTLYDRYLYQKQGAKLDKSPSSPVVTRAYLDSLQPSGSFRVTRSAETSPCRVSYKYDTLSPMTLAPRESKYSGLLKRADNAIKSCDNIPLQLKNAASSSYLDKSKQRSHQDLHSSSYK